MLVTRLGVASCQPKDAYIIRWMHRVDRWQWVRLQTKDNKHGRFDHYSIPIPRVMYALGAAARLGQFRRSAGNNTELYVFFWSESF